MVFVLFTGKYDGTCELYGIFEEECFAQDMGEYQKFIGRCDYYFVEKQPLIRGEYV